MELDRLQLRGPGESYNAIIETPRGSRVKFAYDAATGLFLAKRRLPAGYAFPFPFGFFPSTRAGDGDPLDMLLLTDLELPPGTLVHVELLGVLEMEQHRPGSQAVRNDRVLAIPVMEHADRQVQSLDDLPSGELDDLARFFVAYQAADGVEVRLLGRAGPEEAARIVDSASVSLGR